MKIADLIEVLQTVNSEDKKLDISYVEIILETGHQDKKRFFEYIKSR